ncbi:HAMP domain-containing histidine kinase [Desulfobotulus sp. H1]|uniref:histidine kinase n=1 Tax=Desulfobotulus pelophilus TaxID=2823377 RepID=A0ABT3N6E8_9BACT|nr:HAMP domain-containing sensor histidine kinase [Desulfobotulus pelophilus]MCW7753015.1 HAMP domain-containing histidine kinase [Desulfobotulus pelophilus]
MKYQISLKWFVTLSFLTIALILVSGYSLLSMHFFVRGMDNIIAGNMAEVVATYVQITPAENRRQPHRFSGYWIAAEWGGLPENIRHSLTKPEQTGLMVKKRVASRWWEPPDKMHFLMAVDHDGTSYFVVHTATRETVSALVGNKSKKSLHLLAGISMCSLAAIVSIIWVMLRQVERRVGDLGRWARELDEKKLLEAPPDFAYAELNTLAALIRTSLCSVQESLEREYRFLRYSSHELRTPISVIRSNVELLYKRMERGMDTSDSRQRQCLNRIDRASLTMKNLTETLLWLSWEPERELPVKKVDLEMVIRSVLTEILYLLNGKKVDLVIKTEPCRIMLAEIPARIVLANLIRNAFQHTWEGDIRIRQKGAMVWISNCCTPEHGESRDSGFGFGLQLTENLSQRLGWSYTSKVSDGRHSVCLSMDGDRLHRPCRDFPEKKEHAFYP